MQAILGHSYSESGQQDLRSRTHSALAHREKYLQKKIFTKVLKMAHLEIVEMIEAHGSRPRTLWERILSSQHTLSPVC